MRIYPASHRRAALLTLCGAVCRDRNILFRRTTISTRPACKSWPREFYRPWNECSVQSADHQPATKVHGRSAVGFLTVVLGYHPHAPIKASCSLPSPLFHEATGPGSQELELGVSVQILTHSLSHSFAWIARLIAPKRLQFLQRLATGRVRPIGGHVCRDKLDDE